MGLHQTLPAVGLLALAGCQPCPASGTRQLGIGTGESEFVSLDTADGVYELVHGPQGGWHVLLGFSATGLAGDAGITVATAEGSIQGQAVAGVAGQWLALTCDESDGAWKAWNVFLIFDVTDPAPLHLAPLDVRATLTDARGRVAEGQVSGTILDPLVLEGP